MFSKINYTDIITDLPKNVTLVAVSKTKPNADVMEAYHEGHRDFGENRIQDMVQKYEALPKDIHWHMIGHVQRNKIKYMAHFVHLIHGVDKLKTLVEIDKQAEKNNRVIRCLLQVHIAEEDTKFGFDYDEVKALFSNDNLKSLKNIEIVGLMGMATFTDDQEKIRREFRTLHNFYKLLQKEETPNNVNITELSMGMSSDYKIALDEGSTMVRIGSAIFGSRHYIV